MADVTFRDFAAAYMQADEARAAAHLEALLGLAPPAAVAATAHFRAAASTHGPAFMGQAMGLRTAVTTGTDDDIAALLTTCFGLDATSLPAAIAALRTRYPTP